jgi:predicted 2-oxoglutarate/Fe(II)-dependent dioxygenase YbiX
MTREPSERCEPGQWAALVPYLDGPTCDRIAQRCRPIEAVVPHVVGQDSAPHHRAGRTRLIPRSADFDDVYALLLDIANHLIRAYFRLDITDIVKPPQFVEYPAGRGHFHWHNDYGLETPISSRKLTISIQLSDPDTYDGGDLEVFGCPDPLPRERGSAIVLPAYVEHRVTPVTRGVRSALIGWLAGPPLR